MNGTKNVERYNVNAYKQVAIINKPGMARVHLGLTFKCQQSEAECRQVRVPTLAYLHGVLAGRRRVNAFPGCPFSVMVPHVMQVQVRQGLNFPVHALSKQEKFQCGRVRQGCV
eukprot:scaffold18446_cov20-Tisochrysis_lutea.AAC.1